MERERAASSSAPEVADPSVTRVDVDARAAATAETSAATGFGTATPPPPRERADQAQEPTVDDSELAEAAVSGTASFEQLAKAYYGRLIEMSLKSSRRPISDLYPGVRAAVQRRHGNIEEEFWTDLPLYAGAIRTDREFWSFANWLPAEAGLVDLLNQCRRTAIRVAALPAGSDRDVCLQLIYENATEVLAAMQRVRGGAAAADEATERVIKGGIEHFKQVYERAAERRAQLIYFVGMLYGFGVLLAAASIGLAITGRDAAGLPLSAFAASFVAGGLGAVVSVMSRMTFGELKLSFDATGPMLQLLGGFRPIIGAVFGAAMHVLALSGLIPVALPEDTAKVPIFFVGLAFLAGFSERWAQDMLASKPKALEKPSA